VPRPAPDRRTRVTVASRVRPGHASGLPRRRLRLEYATPPRVPWLAGWSMRGGRLSFPVKQATARHGPNAARALRSAGGTPPAVTGLLEHVQIDHTEVDLVVVDERHRLPIGRAYVTVGIDVCSRCIVGLAVTLEAPSALSVGLRLTHMAIGKRAWLERLGAAVDWPMSGKPAELYLNNAAGRANEDVRLHSSTPATYRPPLRCPDARGRAAARSRRAPPPGW
jgi:hypothetical protein